MTITLDTLQAALRKRDNREKGAVHFANNVTKTSGWDFCHDKQDDKPSGFTYTIRNLQIHVEAKYVKRDGSLKKRGLELIRQFKEIVFNADVSDPQIAEFR